MTEKLKTLMDEVTAMQDFASPDLDAIVRDGDRVVRRQRAVIGGAAVATAAVAAGAVVLVSGGMGTGDTQVSDAAIDSAGMSWATGSVIHTPTSSVEVGSPVRAYVRTDVGYVTVDQRGTVRSIVGDDVMEVGRMEPSSLYLTSDTEDSLAAWLQHEPGGDWSWVVFDQERGRRLATFEEGRAPDIVGVVVALDGRRLFVHEGRDYMALDVDDGLEEVVDGPARDAQLLSVESGIQAWVEPGDDGGESEYVLGRVGAEQVRITSVEGFLASFSPDGRWISFDADEPRVFDAATGERVAIDLEGRVFGAGYEWLDDDSLAVIASRDESGPIELLVCQVPAGSCDVAAPDLGSFDRAIDVGFALPSGEVIDD